MKIGDIKDTTAQLIQQYQRSENMNQSVDKQQAGGAMAPEETVDLSAKSKDLQQIKNAVASLPEVREEKVQELKTQIEKGTYRINSAKIAEKMVGEALIDIFA